MVMNRSDTNIETVTVKVSRLLTTLKENLEKHKADYETAMAGYRDAKATKLAALNEATNKAVTNNTNENRKAVHDAYNAFSRLERPRDHSESYELAIEIMEWSTEDEVELSINDFQCYVRDKWNWKQAFAISVANYANHTH